MFTKFTFKGAVMLCAAAAVYFLFAGGAAWALTAKTTPQDIPIKLLYHGARVTI